MPSDSYKQVTHYKHSKISTIKHTWSQDPLILGLNFQEAYPADDQAKNHATWVFIEAELD